MHFRNYRLQKAWFNNCLKSPLSEYPSTGNIANGLKHCWNVNDGTFTTFINHCEAILV